MIVCVKKVKLTPYGEQRLQWINTGLENHQPLKRSFWVEEWTKKPKFTIGIGIGRYERSRNTGLRLNLSRDRGIEESYWRLWYFFHFQIFPGNFDRNTIVTKHLCSGIVARHLRIIAHDHHDHCCMRIEIFGIPLARGKLYSMFISAGFAWLTLRTTIRKETIPFHPTLISLWV